MPIERTKTNERSSKIVRHNGIVYLSGQVGDGETLAEQANDCLALAILLNLTKFGTLGFRTGMPRQEPVVKLNWHARFLRLRLLSLLQLTSWLPIDYYAFKL